jgi:hypothetical protein
MPRRPCPEALFLRSPPSEAGDRRNVHLVDDRDEHAVTMLCRIWTNLHGLPAMLDLSHHLVRQSLKAYGRSMIHRLAFMHNLHPR